MAKEIFIGHFKLLLTTMAGDHNKKKATTMSLLTWCVMRMLIRGRCVVLHRCSSKSQAL